MVNELKNLKDLFRDEDLEDYEITLDAPYALEVEFSDGYEKEIIIIQRTFNVYGVNQFVVWIYKIDLNNEIQTPETCHECCDECENYNENYNAKTEYCKLTENQIDVQIKREQSKPKLFTKSIRLSTIVHEENCQLNIPHYHLFVGKELKLETNDVNEVKAVLSARNIIFDLYQTENLKKK